MKEKASNKKNFMENLYELSKPEQILLNKWRVLTPSKQQEILDSLDSLTPRPSQSQENFNFDIKGSVKKVIGKLDLDGNYNEISKDDYYSNTSEQNVTNTDIENTTIIEDIKKLLLINKEEQNPFPKTKEEQEALGKKVVQDIENNTGLMNKIVESFKFGSLAAFDKTLDNPAGAFISEAIKKWLELRALT